MRVTEQKCCVWSKTGQPVAKFAGVPKFGRATLSCYGGCANDPGAIKMKMHLHFRYRTEPNISGTRHLFVLNE